MHFINCNSCNEICCFQGYESQVAELQQVKGRNEELEQAVTDLSTQVNALETRLSQEKAGFQKKVRSLTYGCCVFSSSGPKDPMSLCHGVASGVRPSFRPSTVFKMLLLRHFSTDFDSDCFIR